MPADKLETLCEVNRRLRAALIRLQPERSSCANIRPQDFSAILDELLRAAECLRTVPAPVQAAVFAEQAADYRRNLESLKRFLPALQVRLLAEKSRLETAQSHVASAAEWADANQKIL